MVFGRAGLALSAEAVQQCTFACWGWFEYRNCGVVSSLFGEQSHVRLRSTWHFHFGRPCAHVSRCCLVAVSISHASARRACRRVQHFHNDVIERSITFSFFLFFFFLP